MQNGLPTSYQLLSFTQQASSDPTIISDADGQLYITWLESGDVSRFDVFYAATTPDLQQAFNPVTVDDVTQFVGRNNIWFTNRRTACTHRRHDLASCPCPHDSFNGNSSARGTNFEKSRNNHHPCSGSDYFSSCQIRLSPCHIRLCAFFSLAPAAKYRESPLTDHSPHNDYDYIIIHVLEFYLSTEFKFAIVFHVVVHRNRHLVYNGRLRRFVLWRFLKSEPDRMGRRGIA